MVYNSGQPGIDAVRKQAGNLLTTDYLDADITENINAAFSQIQMALDRTLTTPLVSTDVEYGFVKKLEAKIAQKECLKPYGGPDNLERIRELEAEIATDLKFLEENVQNVVSTITSAMHVYTPAALTYPKNPDAAVYRSIKGGSSSALPYVLE